MKDTFFKLDSPSRFHWLQRSTGIMERKRVQSLRQQPNFSTQNMQLVQDPPSKATTLSGISVLRFDAVKRNMNPSFGTLRCLP